MKEGVLSELKKSNDTMKYVKKTFEELAQMLSQVSSAKSLVEMSGFSELFAKAYGCLGELEKECIQYKSGEFNFYDAISRVVENIDTVQSGVNQIMQSEGGKKIIEMYTKLNERLKDTKAILKELNSHLNGVH